LDVTPATKIDKITKLLKKMELSSGLSASAVISREGLPITSAMPSDVNEEIVGAMTAAMLSLGERAVDELTRGNLEQLFVKGNAGYLIIMSAGPSAVLVALAPESALLGLIFLDMKRTSQQVAELL
jgi:predicted regulator of Ras-like GTPase activity (Roadblock/LC7/MglB family)